MNVTTLERTLAFVELVIRHLTTAWSPIRISPSLNIADRIAEGGKCDVLIKLLNFLKILLWLVDGGSHLKLLLRRASFNLVSFQFSLPTLYLYWRPYNALLSDSDSVPRGINNGSFFSAYQFFFIGMKRECYHLSFH